MKIIITESQLELINENRVSETLRDEIKEFGLYKTAEKFSMSNIQLAMKSNIEIIGSDKDVISENDVTVDDLLKELIKMNQQYKNCKLYYYSMSSHIEWECEWENEDDVIEVKTSADATPYKYGKSIPLFVFDLTYYDKQRKYYPKNLTNILVKENGENICPDKFENVNDLIYWFDNVYKPIVYKNIFSLMEQYMDEKGIKILFKEKY